MKPVLIVLAFLSVSSLLPYPQQKKTSPASSEYTSQRSLTFGIVDLRLGTPYEEVMRSLSPKFDLRVVPTMGGSGETVVDIRRRNPDAHVGFLDFYDGRLRRIEKDLPQANAEEVFRSLVYALPEGRGCVVSKNTYKDPLGVRILEALTVQCGNVGVKVEYHDVSSGNGLREETGRITQFIEVPR